MDSENQNIIKRADLAALNAISPIDGRYAKQAEPLSKYFSEKGLIRYRVLVEVEYFIALCKLPLPQLAHIPASDFPLYRTIYKNFTTADALVVKEIERTTNHDVKAVEYFLKLKFAELGLHREIEFLHFGLTSQDINNTAIPLSMKQFSNRVFFPALNNLQQQLEQLSQTWAKVPMLAFTHGQPASPTRLGKEIRVFAERLYLQIVGLSAIPFAAKFGGATGNFNAHFVAYPEQDWHSFAYKFVEEKLGLVRSFPTTQIEHYDRLAEYCDAIRRINVILIDMCRDIWQYISLGYFRQKIKAGEVGSSAMPHKVNPIDFENAEGNLGLANALFNHFSEKLPISRLQRDLTDSTVLRNLGVPLAHTLIALNSIGKGLQKLELDQHKINKDLAANVVVIAEGIQTILRREGYPKPYEALKALTRNNQQITLASISEFIDGLDVTDAIKEELKTISPHNYTGM